MRSSCVTLALLALLGCEGPSTGADAGDEDDAGPAGLAIPLPDALPLGGSDVLRLGPGLILDVASTMAQASDGSVSLVFESFDRNLTTGELWITSSPEGRRFTLPVPLGFTDQPLEASPSFVRGTLYFAAAADLTSAPTLYRAIVGAPEALPAVEGMSSLLSWPRLHAWGERAALVFRDGASLPAFASGDDLEQLGEPVTIGADPAAMVALGVFGDGSLALAYQHPVGDEPMVSFIRRSDDGATWTDPVRVTGASDDVHDTALAARADGGLDLYYIYPEDTSGFALFRRALSSDGSLGVEERVTAGAIGEPSKPSALRLTNGRVLLAFAAITARGATGEPTRQELVLASLPSEAPAP